MPIQPKVFISHSSEDHSFVDWLCGKFDTDLISYFRDDRDILVGDSLTRKISTGLENSNFFLVVLSSTSVTSPWVQRELNAALMQQVNKKRIIIVPVLLNLSPADMPILLQDVKAARFEVGRYDDNEYGKIKESILNKTKIEILQRYQDSLLDNFTQIDEIVAKAKPTRMEVQNILELLQKEKVYQDYFFAQANTSHWFELLKIEGFLLSDKAPSPQLADKEGYYSTPRWNALPYLEKVAQQLKGLPDADRTKYESELMEIIRAVSKKRREILQNNPDDIALDNYRTWFSFAKILACLPKEKISDDIIKCFGVWIESKFDSTLSAIEILKNILPKFLDGDPTGEDIARAEQITETMLTFTEVTMQKPVSAFDNQKKFRLLVNDYWLSEAYIKHGLAGKLGQKCSMDFVLRLAGQLKKLIGQKEIYRFAVDHENHNYLLAVSRTEDEFICELKIRPKPEKEDFILDMDSFQSVIRSKPFECQTGAEFKEKVLSAIKGPALPEQATSEIAAQLEQFYAHLWDDYTYIHYRLLGNMHAHDDEAEGILIHILMDILNAKAKVNADETRAIFGKFLGNEYRFPIFARVVIYCYGKNYETYRADFWQLIESRKELLFKKPDFESEIYDLLEDNIGKFNESERSKIAEIILTGPFAPDHTEIQKIYWRQKWYSSLTSDPEFQKKYEECRKKTNTKEFMNFRDSHVYSRYEKSPLTKDDVLRMSSQEIVRFVPEFEEKQKDPVNDPTSEALAEIIQQVAAENPKKFTDDLMPFINTGYRYVYSILSGFWDYLNKNNGDFGWKDTLEFITAYINRDDFWADKFLAKGGDDIINAKHGWVVSSAANLIQIGTQNDDIKAIPPELNDKVWEIIRLCMGRVITEEPSVQEEADPVGKSLNSAEGKWIKALLYLSLRLTRLQGKNSPLPRWKPEFKAAYEDVLARKVRDAYTIFGEYVSNFYYLDKEWTLKKIEEFKNLPPKYWEAFMTGYLYLSSVYDDFYGIMFANYKKATGYEFPDKHAGESLAQHLAVFYLRGLDGLKEGNLLYDFMRSSDKIRIERLIGYLWMQRPNAPEANSKAVIIAYEDNKLKPKVIDFGTNGWRKAFDASINKKIIELWKYLVDFYGSSGIKDDSDKEIVSSLAKFSVFLPELDTENVEWLKASAPYLGLGWNISFVLEYLNRLKDVGVPSKNAKHIADIFLEITNHFLPDYKQEEIDSLLSFLSENGQVENAKSICNRYAAGGREDVIREVYKRCPKEK